VVCSAELLLSSPTPSCRRTLFAALVARDIFAIIFLVNAVVLGFGFLADLVIPADRIVMVRRTSCSLLLVPLSHLVLTQLLLITYTLGLPRSFIIHAQQNFQNIRVWRINYFFHSWHCEHRLPDSQEVLLRKLVFQFVSEGFMSPLYPDTKSGAFCLQTRRKKKLSQITTLTETTVVIAILSTVRICFFRYRNSSEPATLLLANLTCFAGGPTHYHGSFCCPTSGASGIASGSEGAISTSVGSMQQASGSAVGAMSGTSSCGSGDCGNCNCNNGCGTECN
jgi:hypothetical protein